MNYTLALALWPAPSLRLLPGLEGPDVAAAETGRQAVDLVRARHFDVILSDLGLPDIPPRAA